MSLGKERIEIVEETLRKEEERLGLRNNELYKIWQYEYGRAADDARNLIDDIDEQIELSLKDINLEEFLDDENNSTISERGEQNVSQEN